MSTTHTPEPWICDLASEFIMDGDQPWSEAICQFFNEQEGPFENKDANAARIVACVNAMAGVEDPERFRKERDEFLAALKELVELKETSEKIKARAQAFITAKDNGDTVDLEDDYLIAMKTNYDLRRSLAWQRAKEVIEGLTC